MSLSRVSLKSYECAQAIDILTVRLSIDPTVVLVSTKIDDTVIDCFDPDAKSMASMSGDNDQFRLPFVLEVRPPSEFYYDAAKGKLVSLRLDEGDHSRVSFNVPGELTAIDNGDEEGALGQQGQLLRLAGCIDLESRATVRLSYITNPDLLVLTYPQVGCAGALIAYLQRRRAATYLPGDHTAHLMFRISKLEMFSLCETMFVNVDTLRSLQILGAESHPHSHNRGPTKSSSGAKEGLSVYGLFHHLARTSQGRFLLRQYFLRPSLNLDVIDERMNTVSVFTRPDNDSVLQTMTQNLKSIGNMRTMLISLKKGVSGSSKGRGGLSRSIWVAIRAVSLSRDYHP